jgi:hypothetical protein
MINRTCLCDPKVEEKTLVKSEISTAEARRGTRLCVAAARACLQVLPTSPELDWLFQCTPFWCTLYYIVQSTAILSLEISFAAVQIPEPVTDIIDDA